MTKLWRRMRLLLRVRRFVPFLKEFFLSQEVSTNKKVLSVAMLVGYWLLPFDLVPDFLSFFGFLDDAAVMLLILQQIIKMAPPALRERYSME